MMELELISNTERLCISCDNSSNEKIYINFISILDETKKKKEAIRILSNNNGDSDFICNVENWILQKMASKDLDLLKKIPPLIELSETTRGIIRKNFNLVCEYIKSSLSTLCDEQKSLERIANCERRNEYAMIVVKSCLQIIQFLPGKVKEVASSNDETSKILGSIFSLLITILSSKVFTKECSSLAGTTMALFFNLGVPETLGLVLDLLDFLAKTNSIKKEIVWKKIVVKFPEVNKSEYSILLFINGFTTTNSALLLQETPNNEIFLNVMFTMIKVEMYHDPVSKYVCFQTLLSWLNYIDQGKLSVLLSCNKSSMFIDENSFYCSKIFDWVWKHMEDLVDGIPSFVRQIFALTMKLHNDEKSIRKIESTQKDFFHHLAQKIFEFPWHVKGRWSLLAELISFVSYDEIIMIEPFFVNELLQCLTTCGLTAISNDVYQSILKNMKSIVHEEHRVMKEWIRIFFKPLINALQSETIILRQNIGQYWIPSTARILPECLLLIEKEIRSFLMVTKSPQLFHAYILIIKSSRSHALIKNKDLVEYEDLLSQALFHSDLEVRIETFNTLCCNPKKTEPLPVSFLFLLLNFVEDNLNNDSSRFRQQLISSLKKLVINVRESSVLICKKYLDSIKVEKPDDTSKQLLENLIKFIQSLITLSKSCLHPGAFFQRKKTGLLLFQLISELFVFMKDGRYRKKGAAPDSALKLFNFLDKERNGLDVEKLDIISSTNFELISCIEDQHDEIRELAFEILDYHQQLSGDQLFQNKENFSMLMSIALSLLDSPKYHSAESGAMMVCFIFNRLIDNVDLKFSLKSFISNNEIGSNDTSYMALSYFLLERGKKYRLMADQDFLLAASQRPIYGIFLAFSQILNRLAVKKCSANLRIFIKELVMLCDSMCLLTVQLLSGTYVRKSGNDCTEASPSFADIDGALDEALKDCPSYTDMKISLGHLHCRELLVSFCWLNLKAISSVLVAIGNVVSSFGIDSLLLDMDTLGLIYNFYKNSLIKCRHKGVIEGALVSLTSFAKSLSSMYWKELKIWCSSVMKSAVDMSQTASVTKRSAGIPMFIQAILTAEPSSENRQLLIETIQYLLVIAKTELPSNIIMTVDLPQFNAINIMRAIFRDASLGNAVLSMVEEALMLTIDGFSSVSWSIRNASTILLGTLVPRMLGQRVSQEENNLQNTSTVDVFFYRYPKLVSYFQKGLEIQIDFNDKKKANFITPHVIPILTFLSKLSSGEKLSDISTIFIPILNSFLSSPVFTIRDLASAALLSFTPLSEYVTFVEQIIQQISRESNKNKIHGLCMVLLKSIKMAKCRTDVGIAICQHYEENGVFSSINGDLPSLGILIDILAECIILMGNATKKTEKYIKSMVQHAKMLTGAYIGKTYFYKALSKVVVLFLCNEQDCDLLENVKNVKSNDLHLFFFRFVYQRVKTIDSSMKSLILQFSLKTILDTNSGSLLVSSLTCFHSMIDRELFLQISDISSLLNNLFELLDSSLRFVPVLLPLLEKMLSYCQHSFQNGKELIERKEYMKMVNIMAELVNKYSCSEVGEDLRLAAAQSLSLFKQLLQLEKEVEISASFKHILRITLSSAVKLLQDEDESVRREANAKLQFINDIVIYNNISLDDFHDNTKSQESVQCNVTIRNLFKFVERKALTDYTYFTWLIDMLVEVDYCDIVENNVLFEQEASNLYAEEMVLIHLTLRSLDSILTGLATNDKEHFELYFDVFQMKLKPVFKSEMDWVKKMLRSRSSNESIYGIFGIRKCFILINRLVEWINMVFCHSTIEEKIEIKKLYISELVTILKNCKLPPLLMKNYEKIDF